jgi:multiple sugar transport system permease protein
MAINKGKLFRRDKIFSIIIIIPALIILIGLLGYPLYQSFYNSFTSLDLKEIENTEFVGINNYIEAFQDPDFINSLKANAWFTTSTIIFQFIIGLIIALTLSYRRLAARGVFRTLLFIPMFVAPVVIGYQFMWLFNDKFGVLNEILRLLGFKDVFWLAGGLITKISVIIADSWNAIPFMVLVLGASIITIPQEQIEAAQIDGSSGWKLFRYIILPNIKYAIIVVLLIRVMDSIKTFDIIYVLTRGGPATQTELISLNIFKQSFSFFRMGYASALSYIQFFIILAFSIILIRGLVKR